MPILHTNQKTFTIIFYIFGSLILLDKTHIKFGLWNIFYSNISSDLRGVYIYSENIPGATSILVHADKAGNQTLLVDKVRG